jgi:hypothetical protein
MDKAVDLRPSMADCWKPELRQEIGLHAPQQRASDDESTMWKCAIDSNIEEAAKCFRGWASLVEPCPQSGGNRRVCLISCGVVSDIGCEMRYLESICRGFCGRGICTRRVRWPGKME